MNQCLKFSIINNNHLKKIVLLLLSTIIHIITHLNNFKGDFLNILMFLHPQIPDFQILFYHNKPYINGKLFIQISDDA